MKLWMFMLAVLLWAAGGYWLVTHISGMNITSSYGFGLVLGSLTTFSDFKLAPKNGLWELF